MAQLKTAKSSIRNPLLALIATWVLFMLGSYIDMGAPETQWAEDGPIYPEPTIQWQAGKTYFADEIGTLKLTQEPRKEIRAGDVGYLITGIKEAKAALDDIWVGLLCG